MHSIFGSGFYRIGGTQARIAAYALLAVMAVLIPLCNLAFPEDSWFHISDLTVKTLGKYLCFALLALALDLIWGYTGILSLGHAAFFALGSYCMGIHLLHNNVASGIAVSDLTVLSMMDMRQMPWFWWGFDSFAYTVVMIFLVPGIFAYLFGFFTFRSRVTGVYFTIITQAMTYALFLLFRQNDVGLGGTNGLNDFKYLLGASLSGSAAVVGLYLFSLAALVAVYLMCRWLINGRVGRILTCIRDAEPRVLFSGYNTLHFKLFVWTLSAVICGLAGALFAPQIGIVTPDQLSTDKSIEIAIWTTLGGRGSLGGPVVGAASVAGMQSWMTSLWVQAWQIILGLLFVLAPIFFVRGLAGVIRLRPVRLPLKGG